MHGKYLENQLHHIIQRAWAHVWLCVSEWYWWTVGSWWKKRRASNRAGRQAGIQRGRYAKSEHRQGGEQCFGVTRFWSHRGQGSLCVDPELRSGVGGVWYTTAAGVVRRGGEVCGHGRDRETAGRPKGTCNEECVWQPQWLLCSHSLVPVTASGWPICEVTEPFHCT